ncbi:hypothetical protein [Thiocapsa sp.]|uniref:hypothetical protein n=1 Tax=Thiocapsa sp. TaxID=2024551 RepID=UPI00359433AE
MPPSTDGNEVREHLFDDLRRGLRLVDLRSDGSGQNDVGLVDPNDRAPLLVGATIGHGINKPDVRNAYALECTADIGDPTGQPVSCDFRTTAVTVRLDHQYTHENSS